MCFLMYIIGHWTGLDWVSLLQRKALKIEKLDFNNIGSKRHSLRLVISMIFTQTERNFLCLSLYFIQ